MKNSDYTQTATIWYDGCQYEVKLTSPNGYGPATANRIAKQLIKEEMELHPHLSVLEAIGLINKRMTKLQ